jgi:hypothetical protein
MLGLPVGLDVITSPKNSVQTVSTTPIALTGLQTLNGYTTLEGDRVGVIAQADPAENGIYDAGATGWTRSFDFDQSSEVNSGDYFFVAQGDKQGFAYLLTTPDPIVLNVTGLSFLEINHDLIYDGIVDNEGALPTPSSYLGQTWWGFDEKQAYLGITNLLSIDTWQATLPQYDPTSDTFNFPTTQDGQTQNVGQELFENGINQSGVTVTENDPRVFTSTGANVPVNTRTFDMILADPANIAPGSILGMNTTVASNSVIESQRRFKFVVYGDVGGVDTSAWSLNTILWIDVNSPGVLVDVQPASDAIPVGVVNKVDAVDGRVFVNLLNPRKIDVSAVPLGLARFFITGDEETTTEGTFFLDKFEDPGTVDSDTATAVVPDDSTVASSQGFLGAIQPFPNNVKAGTYNGQQEVQIDQAGGEEALLWEVYLSDDQGVVIDSGIATEPVGSLGVKTIIRLTNAFALNMPVSTTQFVTMRGVLAQDFNIGANQRLRTEVLCTKIGTAGGNKTFTLYYGFDHLSYLDVPAPISSDDVTDLSDDGAGNVTAGLNNRLRPGGAWVDGVENLKYYVYKEGGYLGWPLVNTFDHLEPQFTGDQEPSIADDANFVTDSDASIVKQVHKFTMLKSGFFQIFQVIVPSWDSDVVSKITIINITTSEVSIIENRILQSAEYTTISVGSVLGFETEQYEIWFELYNSSDANNIQGGWLSNLGTGTPLNQEFNINSLTTPSVIEIDHTDLDSTDRSTELDGVVIDSIITINETGDASRNIEVIVDSVDTVSATSTKYTVTLISNGQKDIRDGQVCTINIDVPITQPTQFNKIIDYYLGSTNQPSWATFSTELYYYDAQQPSTTDAYGINITFQEANISPDWFIVPLGGSSSGGSSGSKFSDNLFKIYNANDDTKKLSFDVSPIATSTEQTITMPNDDVDLGLLVSMPANTVRVNNAAIAGALVDLPMAANTMLARLDSGNIVAATIAQIQSLLGVGVFPEEFNGLIREGDNDTLTLIQDAKYARTINEITVQSLSGTATYDIKINGASVTGLSSISVSSVENTDVATGLNSVAISDKVTLVRSSNSDAVDVSFTIKLTRT